MPFAIKPGLKPTPFVYAAKLCAHNPGVMELEAINKWNGTLPQYMTSNTAVPFVSRDNDAFTSGNRLPEQYQDF